MEESRLAEWAAVVGEKLPHLSKAQATVLALWSFGIVMAQSCGLHNVSIFLADLLQVKENSMRRRLREWYKEATAKQGEKRTEIEASTCFVPLVRWVLSWWSAGEKRLAMAMDASSLGKRFVVLAISIVYRGCAIPIAWVVLKEGTKGEWRPHWEQLFATLQGAIPQEWTVIVLADRGLYARWLFQCIQQNGWHPFLRVNHTYGTLRRAGSSQFLPLKYALPQPGTSWSGPVTCFQSNPLACTLLACWDERHCDPWLILTDLAPNQANVFWYGLRPWIECGFKQTKRAGWAWQQTRMTDPARATRLWVAIAVATLWVVSVGGEAEANLPPSSFAALPLAHVARTLPHRATCWRPVSCFRRGILVILAALVAQRPLPLGRFLAFDWPTLDHLTFATFDDS